jgi:aryl-alcohol dehydrogenase-like predicted oxidoreductase
VIIYGLRLILNGWRMTPARSDCRAISLRVQQEASRTEAAMDKRRFGRTGLEVSLLGFGCGAVGGLMIKGAAADQERAVWRALELGINYFDTAQMYGDGESERNLGRVLKVLKPDCYVGTKVRLPPTEPGKIGQAIAARLRAAARARQAPLFRHHRKW